MEPESVDPVIRRYFWVRSERGNHVALPIIRATDSQVKEAFQSTSAAGKADPEMVAAFKEMKVGEALVIPKEAIGANNPRSVKITVGKAAKEAGWKLNYKPLSGGFVAKIVAPIVEGENGSVEEAVDASESEPEATTNGATEEAVTSSGRRGR